MEKLPIKIAVTVFVAVCLYWLAATTAQWRSSDESADQGLSGESIEPDQLISSIQAISDATDKWADQGNIEKSIQPLSEASEKILAQRFSEVNQLINRGEFKVAISELETLTREYPRVIELYINLAAMYAASQQLDLASSTLEKAMQANPNTAALFKSVQKVYGAKAANAYQLALGKDDDTDRNTATQTLDLPVIASLDTRQAQQSIIGELRAQLSEAQAINVSLRADYAKPQNSNQAAKGGDEDSTTALEEQQRLVIALQSKAMTVAQDLPSLQGTRSHELDSLRDQPMQQSTPASAEQLHQQDLLSDTQQQDATQVSRLQADREALAAKQERARLAQLAQKQQGADEEVQLNKVATELVGSWAAAWQAQDVAAYINHYANNYTPAGSSISHIQWREQSRVRLTNKEFIQVSVSDFSVIDQGDRFAVSFTQHYKSNSVDDRIRKRLVFAKGPEGIGNPKIVVETVI